MNEKFFALPVEKQQAILNAGYRVFSQNTYKKSPVSEIADAAGISKSLLFYYFRNKKELYLFLWETSIQVTLDALKAAGCYEPAELFESMFRGLKAKVQVIRQYPDLGAFTMKAYYEKNPEVCGEIQESIEKYRAFKSNVLRLNFDPEQFASGLDMKMMYQDMFWASEGYLWEKVQQGDLDVDRMEQEFTGLMEFWKKIYLKKSEKEGGADGSN